MTLNFQKHGEALLSAYNRVVSSKTNDEWVIFDYEGCSNIIKVGDEGDNGLEEFAMSFNSGRLQYGVVGVRLAGNAINKIVLVHWHGEGVPSARIASMTSHLDAVRRLLKTVHVTIYARSEVDVEPDAILREVAKLPSTASSVCQANEVYSLGRQLSPPRRGKPTIPNKLSSERLQTFEKKDHHHNLAPSIASLSKRMEPWISTTHSTFSSSVSSLRNSTSSSFSAAHSPNDSGYEACIADSSIEDRREEIHISNSPGKITGNVMPEEALLKEHAHRANQHRLETSIEDFTAERVQSDDSKRCVKESLNAVALWDYQAADDSEISFNPDDIITDIDQVDPGWWRGRGPNGDFGLFPANYVHLI